MRVLIETRLNALRLNESKKPRKGCLGHLEGVCADYKNPTRNGRLYPLPLWEKVFKDSIFKESLENHTLFGELDHPEDRFEPLMSKACIVMTDYRIDEDEGLIYGGFDILDTPDGRILKSILDYGSVVGVSSRGQGDIIESAEGEVVSEDSYEFACFDVVSTPAVEKARQTVSESMKKKTFKESVEKQIKDADTISDLNIIRSVVRASDMNKSDMDIIVESIEDKCKSIQSGEKTILPDSNDLHESTTTTLESAKTIRENKKLYRCISALRSQVSAYKHREKRYAESMNRQSSEIDKLNAQLYSERKKYRLCSKEVGQYKEQLSKIKETSDSKTRRLSEAKTRLAQSNNDAKSLRDENSKLTNDLRNLKESLSEKSRKLTETLSDSVRKDHEIDELRRKLSIIESNNSRVISEQESEISNIDEEVTEYSMLLDEAREKLSKSEESIKSMNETLVSERNKRKELLSAYKDLQESYIKKSCKMSGLDYQSIRSSIKTEDSAQRIDKLVESRRRQLDKYSTLTFSMNDMSCGKDALIESIRKPTQNDIEDSRLDSFLENTQKSL